jgi:hypothetical protein
MAGHGERIAEPDEHIVGHVEQISMSDARWRKMQELTLHKLMLDIHITLLLSALIAIKLFIVPHVILN